jgi:hypothetical protein
MRQLVNGVQYATSLVEHDNQHFNSYYSQNLSRKTKKWDEIKNTFLVTLLHLLNQNNIHQDMWNCSLSFGENRAIKVLVSIVMIV